jgi:hypothetical protein
MTKVPTWYEITIHPGDEDLESLDGRTVNFTRINGVDHARYSDLESGSASVEVNRGLLRALTIAYHGNLKFLERAPLANELRIRVQQTPGRKVEETITSMTEYNLPYTVEDTA